MTTSRDDLDQPESAAPRLPMADGAPPEDGVLADFTELRDGVLDVMERGQRYGAVLGPNAAQVAPLFAAARTAIDASRLNLTVIGAEGVGKSTLINAIAGAELTPRERDHPGTVAPTYAEAGDSPTPQFSVTLRGADGRETVHRCADIAEFRTYLLQHENRENVRGVVRGVVRYNHPVLRRGLRLVDMPGVHASSPLVNQEARRFLAEETHAVVAVTYSRTGFGALHEVFRDLEVRRDHVQAVVINQDLGYFVDAELEPLPDDELRPKMEETRQAASEELGVPAEDIFVINLASWYGARVQRARPLASAVHAEEIARFQRRLWTYMRENGVAEVIDRAADDATTALHGLFARLDLMARTVNALAGGDKGAGKRLEGQFKEARKGADQAWRRVSGEDVALAVAAQQWPSLKAAADGARDDITAAIDTALAEINAADGRISGRQADAWKQRVQDAVLGERDALDTAYGEALRAALDYYSAHADAALAGIYEAVPVLAESAPLDRMVVGSGGLILSQMGKMEPSALEQFAKWGAAGGAGALTGNIAGGGGTAILVTALGMNPIAALAIGGAAGMSLALLLWRTVRDEHRDAVVAGLTRYRANALAALDTSPGSTLRREWDAAVGTVSERVGDYLAGQITGVGNLLTTPTAEGAAALAARRASVNDAVDGIERLREELDQIRGRAESLV